jgi:hypothetical protein
LIKKLKASRQKEYLLRLISRVNRKMPNAMGVPRDQSCVSYSDVAQKDIKHNTPVAMFIKGYVERTSGLRVD